MIELETADNNPMISTYDFHKLILRAMGKRIMIAGKKYQDMVSTGNRFISVKYDDIESYKEISENDEVDIHDGQEWITIFAYDKNGIAPDYGR